MGKSAGLRLQKYKELKLRMNYLL